MPDSFVHEKNFKNFTNHHAYGTTRISDDDDLSERSFHENANKHINQQSRQTKQDEIESAIDSIIGSESFDILD